MRFPNNFAEDDSATPIRLTADWFPRRASKIQVMTSFVPARDTAPPAPQRSQFVWRGVRSVGFGVFIGVALHLAFQLPLARAVIHSVSIAALCWLFIDSGRIGLARWLSRRLPLTSPLGAPTEASQWPGWWWMGPIIVLGSVAGFSTGGVLAGWITGHAMPGYLRGDWHQAVSLLALSLVPGVAITYWFYSRATMAAQQVALLTAQRQAAEHQLKLLESQLEPHMLFNTLANLRVLIDLDPPRAQAMLDQLIAFLRATLSGSRATLHPLRDEFARLADYLALMQVRMGARLQLRIDLPDTLAALPVPPLLLQPLVENCIQHGLEPVVAGGRIEISAARDATHLVLTVRDTGAGLTTQAVNDTQFGLVQVRERLATLYGRAASLELRAAGDAQGGTLALLRLPITADVHA